jgi:hypothetical protein
MMMVWTDAAEAGILERVDAAIADTSKEPHAYIKAHAEFMEIGDRMLQQWALTLPLSLKAARATVRSSKSDTLRRALMAWNAPAE